MKVAGLNILKGESRPVDFIECETREARWMVMVFLMVAKIMITVSVVIITMLIIIDLSKLCEFCIKTFNKSCAERRKMTAVN